MTRPIKLGQEFMEILYETHQFDELSEILTKDFQFEGPLLSFNTAEEYINLLRMHPPIGSSYELIRTYEDESSACFLFTFSRPGISTLMAQYFEFTDDKISKISSIFDPREYISQ